MRRRLRRILAFSSGILAAFALFAQQIPCGRCHADRVHTQVGTPMAQALHGPDDVPHPSLNVTRNGYTYKIQRTASGATYTVTDGKDTISANLLWSFGARTKTYVYERQGTYYEALVTYFDKTDALDITPGDQRIHPANLEQAGGRPISALELQRCLNCHATGAVSGYKLSLANMRPGVTCERCHANTAEHLAMKGMPPDLRKLSTERQVEFCGQCHRTWADVTSERLFGIVNVRFQPYRLALSKCYDGVDTRISCLSCHDPHKQRVSQPAAYDKNCIACHSAAAKLSAGMIAAHAGARAMPVCPVSKSNCVTCHMPKAEIPGTRASFADHYIRIVRTGESYPD